MSDDDDGRMNSETLKQDFSLFTLYARHTNISININIVNDQELRVENKTQNKIHKISKKSVWLKFLPSGDFILLLFALVRIENDERMNEVTK